MRSILNIPNILTLGRIIITPVIVYAILKGEPELALAMMIAAGITDMLDGAIARYFNQRTTVGAYLDPLADKLMLISTFVTLFIVNEVPLFLFLAVVFRDAIIVLGALAYEMVTHQLKMEPSMVSKVTTFMQIVCVVTLILDMAYPLTDTLIQTTVWATFIVTCISGIHYMLVWTRKAAHEESK
ncbi:MAG TPA: CDP-alcohol phosphatidyltransferase family protein [Mariprofundaceae bacterium]|nr:CDP-alcohol phosphatidyltransferase family protein [Mariprofundaceae bacterium]